MRDTIGHLVRKILIPSRYKTVRRMFANKNITMLDVGCGNEGYSLARRWLPKVEYHGLDRDYYNSDKDAYEDFDKFFKIDLEISDLSEVEDKAYDFILMSHIIEHVEKGPDILIKLLKKLKMGGIIYIETPSFRTLNFPSANGFLNFYDDPTHKILRSEKELARILMEHEIKVLRAGIRRDWIRCLVFGPISIVLNLIYWIPFTRRINARGLWDLLGVAIAVEGMRVNRSKH